MSNLPRTRFLTIVAQDPSITNKDGNILKAKVEIPAETLALGPCGYRANIIDYDSSTDTHYIPLDYVKRGKKNTDVFEDAGDDVILNNPHFHQQNVYAIVMRTLARFEHALGRRVEWGFDGHQINVAPHAFADANAFYSENDKALMFGYFRSPHKPQQLVFTCLSHDVVAHETTHALLDGLREYYTQPSSPEQAGFHEGFSDVVALLSVFSLKEIVSVLLDKMIEKAKENVETVENMPSEMENILIEVKYLNEKTLSTSGLLGLAEQFGEEVTGIRGNALRRSIELKTLKELQEIEDQKAAKKRKKIVPYLEQEEFEEPHRCGELFVAAMMKTFLKIWVARIDELKKDITERKFVSRNLVIEQGSDAASHLLTMAIRAIDYSPPTDISFGDYLSALLTADQETVPDDSRYQYRKHLKEIFAEYGIEPSSYNDSESGVWSTEFSRYKYDRIRFDSLTRSKDEVFRFIWDNRKTLSLSENAYTKVQSVRPCVRISPDGFILRETVAEYIQFITVQAGELQQLSVPIGKPKGMPSEKEVTLYGGGTLIFDEYGQLKYHVRNRILSQTAQTKRLEYLWKYGFFTHEDFSKNFFSRMHLRRSAVFSNHFVEEEF